MPNVQENLKVHSHCLLLVMLMEDIRNGEQGKDGREKGDVGN